MECINPLLGIFKSSLSAKREQGAFFIVKEVADTCIQLLWYSLRQPLDFIIISQGPT